MGVGRFIHHIGAILLLAATALLIVVDITAPVVNDLALLKVDLASSSSGSAVTFGTFGYCILDADNGKDKCSKAKIGYDPADVITAEIPNSEFSSISSDAAKTLTKVLVLHPVATGLSFIAFLLAIGAGVIGSFTASMVSLLAFAVNIVALACDFAGFTIVKHKVNDLNTSVHAKFGIAIWLVVAAAACNLLATILVFISCCSGRRSSTRPVSRKMYQ